MNSKLKTAIISDIHGSIDEMKELLTLIDYKSPNVRVILLGDLIDRGPDSVACVRLARELDLESVMGNHEFKFLKWWRGNKHYDSHKHYHEFNDDDIAYISRMPYYVELNENLWVVHAGVKPNIPLDKQKPDDLMYLRYTDKDRNFISMHKIAKGEATGAMFWTEFWKGPASVVYGHNVHSLDFPKIEEVSPGVKCYGIDTGCCFGGYLSCIIFEDNKEPEIVQVKAKQVYYKANILDL